VLIDIETRFGIVTCAAYEPSKEFRYTLDWLDPGDHIEVLGELRYEPRTLNIEKIHVISIADEYRKVSNPICSRCGRTMKSKGAGQPYKCKECHTSSNEPVLEQVRRQIVPGWYEPPTAARRHLSKPLKRMGLEQPVEFVNGRS
jgi:tRNA(Ile2)-agmatinylcytidine synthase